MYIDLLGYASYDPFLETDVSGSGRIRLAHSDLVKSFADARGIDMNASEPSPFGDTSLVLKELGSAFRTIGINRDNAKDSAVLLVEKGDDDESVTNYLLDELGGGFREIYENDPALQKSMQARLAGVQQGDLINISDFSQIAFSETAKRAAKVSPHFANIYNNPGAVYDGSIPLFSAWLGNYGYNTAVATDKLAPKKLQDYAGRNLATTAAIDAIMLGAPLKGMPKGTVAARSAAADELLIDSYGKLSRQTNLPGQAHHLNQTAAYRDVIPTRQGASIKLEGNILTDAGAPHTTAHQSLEGFWNQYRGTELVPTNLEYTRALQQSLRAAGLPESQVQQAVRAAVNERVNAGLLGGQEVPRVPRPIRNLAE